MPPALSLEEGRNLLHVLVTASAHTEQNGVVRSKGPSLLRQPRDGVRGLERRNDALRAAEQLESTQRGAVRHLHILGATTIPQV